MTTSTRHKATRNAPPVDMILDIETLGISIDHLVRPLDLQYVSELAETDESEWEPIEVRLWPSEWPKPSVEVLYHVMSGNHRTSAARMKGLRTLRAKVIEANDDLSYLIAAIRTNARHGRNFTNDDRALLASKLKALGQSSSQIAALFGVHKSTINNLLSGRDTNASRKRQDDQKKKAQAQEILSSIGLQELGADWVYVPSVPVDAKRIAKIGVRINDFLAETPMSEEKAYILAWVRSLSRETRNTLAQDMQDLSSWLANVSLLLQHDGEV